MHTLYVAAHGTAVALGAYVTELKHRLEVGARRRHPTAERPTALEITAAQEMIAQFSGFEQLENGWATPDQLASRVDLSNTVKTLYLSMVASLDIAYVVRDTAADQPGLTAPARIIGMRAQGRPRSRSSKARPAMKASPGRRATKSRPID
jgi:hypothetical protein